MPAELVRIATARLPGALAETISTALGEALARGLADARTRWPDAPEPGQPFATFLGERLARQEAQLARLLPKLRIEDVYLVWWALADTERGGAALWAMFEPDLEKLLARFHRLERDELVQQLRVRLFVGEAPRLAEYDGFGFLQNWLRVVASRTFLDLARKHQRDRSRPLEDLGGDDAPLLALVVAPPDVARDADRARVHAAIRSAFAAAVASLEPRARTFLRLATVDGVTLDQLARTYDIGRATVARVLAAARAQLRAETRRGMIEALGLSPAELDSMIRALDSQLELSLTRVLQE